MNTEPHKLLLSLIIEAAIVDFNGVLADIKLTQHTQVCNIKEKISPNDELSLKGTLQTRKLLLSYIQL